MIQIGKGRPPVHTRFKPGTSGNPSGRPKGRRGFLAELIDELAQATEVGDGESRAKVTKQQAVIIALLRKAMRGDLRAIDTVMRACVPHSGNADDVDAPEDQDILKALTDGSNTKKNPPE
jgi:hypothetical protein